MKNSQPGQDSAQPALPTVLSGVSQWLHESVPFRADIPPPQYPVSYTVSCDPKSLLPINAFMEVMNVSEGGLL
jgi:hypothetical protein